MEIIAEPLLDIVRKADRCSCEESGRGRPGLQSFELRFHRAFRSCSLSRNDLEKPNASEHAEHATAIKLQISVDESGP